MTDTTRSKEKAGPVVTPQPLELRDYFAAAALQGLLASPGQEVFADDGSPCLVMQEIYAVLSRRSFQYADAMLKAREALSTG